jgi:DNA-binding NarL/FixJ family response regulator
VVRGPAVCAAARSPSGIAEGAVKLHLHTVYTKLRVDSRTSLILKLNEKAFV